MASSGVIFDAKEKAIPSNGPSNNFAGCLMDFVLSSIEHFLDLGHGIFRILKLARVQCTSSRLLNFQRAIRSQNYRSFRTASALFRLLAMTRGFGCIPPYSIKVISDSSRDLHWSSFLIFRCSGGNCPSNHKPVIIRKLVITDQRRCTYYFRNSSLCLKLL